MLVLAKSFHRSRKPQFPQLADFLYKLWVVVRVCESVFVSLFGVGWYCAVGRVMCVWWCGKMGGTSVWGKCRRCLF